MTNETKSVEEIAREIAFKIEAFAWDDDNKFSQKAVPLIATAIKAERSKQLPEFTPREIEDMAHEYSSMISVDVSNAFEAGFEKAIELMKKKMGEV